MFNKKIKIEIKSVFGNVIFTHECVDNTVAKTVEKAVQENTDLRHADLRFVDLRFVDLCHADLRFVDLRFSNLCHADLRHADLRHADLRHADLRFADLRFSNLISADLDKRYIQIGGIGSSKRVTTYCFDDDEIICGCFKGTLKQFEDQVKETHKNNEQYLKEYLGAIKYIKSIAKDTPKLQD